MDYINNHYNNKSVAKYNSEVEKTMELVMRGEAVRVNSFSPSDKLSAQNDNNETKFPWQV